MADDALVAKEREPSVDRVIAFSDGVVAIAITLLILPLTDIEARPGASLGQVIGENQPALFAFGLSFLGHCELLDHSPQHVRTGSTP